MINRFGMTVGLALISAVISSSAQAFQLAVSQYGRVTASLPWAVAMEKGYFATRGSRSTRSSRARAAARRSATCLASDLPYGEVATSAALAAARSGLDIVIVNSASSHIGEISLVADPKSGVQKMSDLAGKKAGFTAPKSTSEVLLRLALKETHMDGKVEPVATGGFGPGITALTTGAIQADADDRSRPHTGRQQI